MAILSSRYMRVYLGSVAIADATDASISLNVATRDTTTKDSARESEFEIGLKSATISTSGLYEIGNLETTGADLWDAFNNGTTLTIQMRDDSAGVSTEMRAIQYSGFLTSLELNSSGPEDNVTYSASFQCTGAPTLVSVT